MTLCLSLCRVLQVREVLLVWQVQLVSLEELDQLVLLVQWERKESQ